MKYPPCKIGDRVRVTGVMNDPDPLAVGSEGTVDWVGAWTDDLTKQIGVKWDNGRSLILLASDPFVRVEPDCVDCGHAADDHHYDPSGCAGTACEWSERIDEDGLPAGERCAAKCTDYNPGEDD